MKNETKEWIAYADENLKSAEILFDRKLLNPCLQNAQQAIEKYLKSLFFERSIKLHKTHSISDLKGIITKHGVLIELSDDDCELLDSIYLPSKYPLGSVLPDFTPDESICQKCLTIVKRIENNVKEYLQRQ